MHRLGLNTIRDYLCLGIPRVDTEVHCIWHEIWDPPDLKDPAVLEDIRLLGERHENRECSCFDPAVIRVRIDALTNAPVDEGYATLGCMIWEIDPAALAFIRRHVKRCETCRLGTNIRRLLVAEHEADPPRCGCYNR